MGIGSVSRLYNHVDSHWKVYAMSLLVIRQYVNRRTRIMIELLTLSYVWRCCNTINIGFLRRFTPIQLLLGSAFMTHLWKHLSLLLGLHAPHNSLYMEPDMHYSPSFARVRWLLTALDAGVLSTLKVRIPVVKHTLTLIMALWYLVFYSDGEDKVRAFRRSQTVESLIATWEKGNHPVFKAVTRAMAPKLTMMGDVVKVKSDGGSDDLVHTIDTHIFYHGTKQQLSEERQVVLHFPGGGFVCMDPMLHMDYLSKWASELRLPIVSVNYRKAPKYPFPAGLNDCYTVFERMQATQGAAFGINTSPSSTATTTNAPKPRLVVALAGDSAGGNLVATVTVQAIKRGLQRPDGIHMIYPVLDLGGRFWKHTSPLPPKETASTTSRSRRHHRRHPPPPVMTSRAQYAFDGVLPFKYLIQIASVYLKNGGDPVVDDRLSPVRAKADILKQFPPTYIHVGSVDPLHDDSAMFIQRLLECNPKIRTRLHEFPGVSHAYLHVVPFLPEGQHAIRLSIAWLQEIFQNGPLPPYDDHDEGDDDDDHEGDHHHYSEEDDEHEEGVPRSKL